MSSSRFLIFCAVLLVCANLSHAWGETGHRTVAQIAQALLSPSAQKAVNTWLASGETLATIAIDPDVYGHTPEGQWSEKMHYVNVPVGMMVFDYNNSTCVNDGLCAINSIRNFTRVLKSTQPYFYNRTQTLIPSPLSYLVHFAGDIHQPLHISYAVDLGGNLFQVKFKNALMNLHMLWDEGMIESYGLNYTMLATELLSYINANPQLSEQWAQVSDPVVWATESFDQVVKTAYTFLPEKASHMTFSSETKRSADSGESDFVYVAEEYFRRNFPVVTMRLAMAGVRLAAHLNNIYGGF